MEFSSSLPSSLQSTYSPSPLQGTGVEIPNLLLPTMEVPLAMQAVLPSPSGGQDLRNYPGSAVLKASVNQGNSIGGQTIICAILDRGLYRLFLNLNVFQSGFTASSAVLFLATASLQNPEVTIQGDLLTDFGSQFNVFGDFGIFSFQKPGWRIVLTTQSTGAAQTIGAQLIAKISKLL